MTSIVNWVQKLDEVDDYLKKTMLLKIFNKVFLGKNEIEIDLNELNVSFIDVVEGKFYEFYSNF